MMNVRLSRVSRRVAGLAAVAMMALAVRSASAQVLDQVPSDSLVVVKVHDLGKASGKFAAFANELGLAAMVPDLADPLASLQNKLGIKEGLDANGDLAVAVLDPDQFGGPDKSMVILVPVADYKAFLGNFPDAKTDGDVSEVKMGGSQEPGFVANWGKYAALSPNKDIVAKKPTLGIKAQGAAAKELDSRDMVVYANFAAIRPKVKAPLDKVRGEAMTELDNNVTNKPETAKYGPVAKAALNQLFTAADSFFRDAQSATLSLNFGDKGISYAVMAEFEPKTYLGDLAASITNTDAPMLEGLPAGKYLFYEGFALDPKVSTKLLDDLAGPILKELAGVDGNEAKLANDYVTSLRTQLSLTKGGAVGLLTPNGQPGQDPIIQFVGTVKAADPKAMLDATAHAMESQNALMAALGQNPDAIKTTIALNAKTIDGVSFTQAKTEFKNDPNDPMSAQRAQAMAFMYGADGLNVYSGIVGDGNIVAASGVSDQIIGDAIKATKAGDAPLAKLPTVTDVAGSLPKNRAAVAYIQLDEIVTTALSYAKQFGFNTNVQLPPDQPPIGLSLSSEGTAVRGELFIPTDLVKSLVAAGLQAQMQMQNNRPGGGGGL